MPKKNKDLKEIEEKIDEYLNKNPKNILVFGHAFIDDNEKPMGEMIICNGLVRDVLFLLSLITFSVKYPEIWSRLGPKGYSLYTLKNEKK